MHECLPWSRMPSQCYLFAQKFMPTHKKWVTFLARSCTAEQVNVLQTRNFWSFQDNRWRNQRDNLGRKTAGAIPDAPLQAGGSRGQASAQLHRIRQSRLRIGSHTNGTQWEIENADHLHVVKICKYWHQSATSHLGRGKLFLSTLINVFEMSAKFLSCYNLSVLEPGLCGEIVSCATGPSQSKASLLNWQMITQNLKLLHRSRKRHEMIFAKKCLDMWQKDQTSFIFVRVSAMTVEIRWRAK